MARRSIPTAYKIAAVALALVVVGLLVVFDASYAKSANSAKMGFDALYHVRRQVIAAVVGLILMLCVGNLGNERLRSAGRWFFYLGLGGIILVLVPHVGIWEGGACRWLGRGAFRIQPSEIAKLGLVFYLATMLSAPNYPIRQRLDAIIAPLVLIGAFVLLVEREPDLGTAAVLGLTGLGMLICANARWRHILAICGLGLVFVAVVASTGYRQARLQSSKNPQQDLRGKNYQVDQGMIAVSTGNVVGKGIGKGLGKFTIPAYNTDFIFATVAEETGLWGVGLVLGLLAALVSLAFSVAGRCRDPFARLTAAGMGLMIGSQSIINVAVVTRLMPATGVPLPFISYGGSSLVFMLAAVGVLCALAHDVESPARRAAR